MGKNIYYIKGFVKEYIERCYHSYLLQINIRYLRVYKAVAVFKLQLGGEKMTDGNLERKRDHIKGVVIGALFGI